jgi:signal transduction histidine kinase
VPVFCDRDRVVQVLSNLVTNAMKYTPGGKIRVSLRVESDQTLISVSDEGPGIPRDQLEAIFEPHVRLAGPEAGGETKGSGLGLYISKGIIEAHKGQIWAESEEGRGSTFTLSLPLMPE